MHKLHGYGLEIFFLGGTLAYRIFDEYRFLKPVAEFTDVWVLTLLSVFQ
jgi:hypothetical protein